MRVAVVGAGWAGSAHAEAYAAMEGVEIAAIVGKSEARAKALAAKTKTTATTDLAAVLRDETVDAVDVCVPSGLHRQVAVPALDEGKHVFLETPMALTLADAEAMLAAAERNGRTLAVGQVMKFLVPYQMIHGAASSGILGPLRLAIGARLSAPYWKPESPRDFALYGEPMLELMIFEYEVFHWFLGVPRRITATARRSDAGVPVHAFVSLEYDGAVGMVEGSAAMPRSHPFTTYLWVQGEEGAMETRGQFTGGDIPETTFRRYPRDGKAEDLPFEGQDPYAAECLHFVRCVEGRADPSPISGESAREALRVALAARDAALVE